MKGTSICSFTLVRVVRMSTLLYGFMIAIVMGIDVMSIFLREEFFRIPNRFAPTGHLIRLLYFVSPSVSELCAESRCAKKIGTKVINITNIATTFVTGLSRGRVSCEKIQIGKVVS